MPFPEVMFRSRAMDLVPAAEGDAENIVRMVSSTAKPIAINVTVDGKSERWMEVLSHEPGACDTSGARSVLLNHDKNQIVGKTTSMRFDGGECHEATEIHPDAKLPTGIRVIDAVRTKCLTGVSIGYGYDLKDCTVDRASRTITANKWRKMETTLTPIPADTGASVRSLDALPKEPTMPDPVIPADTAAVAAATRAEAGVIATRAKSLGLDATPYLSLDLAGANAKMIDDLAARDARNGGTPGAPAVSHIVVGKEASEKLAERAVGAMLHSAGFNERDNPASMEHVFEDGTKMRDLVKGNPLRGRTVTDIGRATLEDLGVKVGQYDRHHLARTMLGLPTGGVRDAANVSTGYFSTFVFANLISKAVSVGYAMGSASIKFQPWVSRNFVPDYKQFAIGTLGVGNLKETVENAAFPELDKVEGAYLDRVAMWGGTMSLSEQAMVSDDTGQFFRNLGMAGLLALKTEDKRAFQVLMRGISTSDATATYTDNTTQGTIVATTNDLVVAARVNLAKVNAALMNKLGTDGNPTGNAGRFLIVPPTLAASSVGLLGIAPGQQNRTDLMYEVIQSPWLEFSGLVGFAQDTYYLVADPNLATGVVHTTINGYDAPRVEQYDPGAVAAYKWKIYKPFQFGMGQHAYIAPGQTASKTIIAGVQRGTA